MDRDSLKALLEAIIYVSEEPVTLHQLEKALPDSTREELRRVLEELVEASRTPGRGVEIRQVAGGYRMSTRPEHHDAVRQFVRSQRPPLRLSLPALETLAVIAYKQPATQPEIKAIRGVDPASALATLLEKGLVVTAGRKPCIGRPILYRTSKEFLLRFGLKDTSELPSLEEFEDLARASLAVEESPATPGPNRAAGELERSSAGAGGSPPAAGPKAAEPGNA